MMGRTSATAPAKPLRGSGAAVSTVSAQQAAATQSARRLLRLGLGALWLLGGLLQAQPGMFAMDMISNTMQPSSASQPLWLSGLIRWSIRLVTPHLVPFNWAVTGLEIALGGLLLSGRVRLIRIALWLSCLWALTVWIFGEGLGQLLTGSATLLTGAPGTMLLYAATAAVLLVPITHWRPRPEKLPPLPTLVLLVVLVLGAGLQLAPIFWTRLGLASPFGEGAMMPQPEVLRLALSAPIALAFAAPAAFNAALVLSMLGSAALLAWFPAHPAAFWAVAIFLGLVWLLGQDGGMLLGGMATDPNSMPILALLLWSGYRSCLGGCTRIPPQANTRHRLGWNPVRTYNQPAHVGNTSKGQTRG